MDLIVSLTSTADRLPILRYTLLSLSEQCVSADRVVLNISEEPYLLDRGIVATPPWLDEMVRKGEVEINWVKNTGPYRKLLPVYVGASVNDVIITCDDDVIYGSDWLSSLLECAEKYPEAVVCGRARVPIRNFLGVRQSYINWPLANPGAKGMDLVPTGVFGVLYRNSSLADNIVTSEDFLDLAPKQDDLWFDMARRATGRAVVVAAEVSKNVFPVETHQSLSDGNISRRSTSFGRFMGSVMRPLWQRAKGYLGFSVCENDIALKKLRRYLPR